MRKKEIDTKRSKKQPAKGNLPKQLSHHSTDAGRARSYLEPVGPKVPSWIANTKNGKQGSDQELVLLMRNIFFSYYFPPELMQKPELLPIEGKSLKALLPKTIGGKTPTEINREIIEINEFKYEGVLQKFVRAIVEFDVDFLERLTNGAREIRKAQDKLRNNPKLYLWLAYTRYLAECSRAPNKAESRELAKRLWAIDRLREREKYTVPDKPGEADERHIQRVIAQLPIVNWSRSERAIDLRLKPAKSGPKPCTG